MWVETKFVVLVLIIKLKSTYHPAAFIMSVTSPPTISSLLLHNMGSGFFGVDLSLVGGTVWHHSFLYLNWERLVRACMPHETSYEHTPSTRTSW